MNRGKIVDHLAVVFGVANCVWTLTATLTADANQYPVERQNMKRVIPSVNMLAFDFSPLFLHESSMKRAHSLYLLRIGDTYQRIYVEKGIRTTYTPVFK